MRPIRASYSLVNIILSISNARDVTFIRLYSDDKHKLKRAPRQDDVLDGSLRFEQRREDE